jgi:AcrR family transcriptional regulator
VDSAAGDSDEVDRVVVAARRCFLRFGLNRTTMDDIAAEAGIGRTGVYRLGLSRRQLSDAAIVARLSEGRDELWPLMDRDLDFAQILVEGSVAAIEWARHDAELLELVGSTKTTRLHHLLVGRNAMMHDLILSVCRRPFERARAAGQMRRDVTDDRAVDWIQGIYLVLLLRDDLTAEETTQLLRDFLLPALASVELLADMAHGQADQQALDAR